MKWGQLALCWLLAPRCQKELLRGTLGAQIVICLILLGYKLVKPDGCWHKSSFFKVELSISSQHEQQRNRPLTWAWTIRCQPSSVSRIFSAELHQLSPFQLLCPTMHTRTRDRCSQGSQQHLHIPLERKNEGIDGWVRNGQYCFLHVTFMRQFNTHKLCSLAAPLTSDQWQGRWPRVSQSLLGLHCALRITYSLCFHTQTCPHYSSSVLVNWFFSCPKLVLLWPSAKKEKLFP